jgi:ubiquitin-like modifier-activating enzyme ATG7
VSYSNPVRQSLFSIQDCNAENGSGRMKAIAAADALTTIAADVKSEGIVLSIPMPGHPDKEDVIAQAVETLDALIQEADVVYLLTDTRESRWLPTVISTAYNKILINAALGLDSWLVMRHGAAVTDTINTTDGDSDLLLNNRPYRLGCYFCSDVVAPENSTKNRTLDQQCTVTRPGLALIASSMAVELMVSLLHHPKRIFAPAPKNANNTSTQYSPTISSNDTDITAASSTLGIIPHSIRGSLVSYTMMTPTIPAFQYCTGCSKNVTDSYLTDKLNFVQHCCQTTDGSYLEEVSGLTAFRLAAAEKLVDVEGWEDDE